MPISINGSGSITGLSAGGLPDGCVTAGDLASTLDLTGKTVTLPSGTGGKVLQVVSTTKTDVFSTTSSTYVPVTGLSVSITPSSTSSKIFLIFTGYGSNTGAGTRYVFLMRRNSTGILRATGTSNRTDPSVGGTTASSPGSGDISAMVVSGLDTPSTTSSVTYSIDAAAIDGGTLLLNRTYGDQDVPSLFRTVSTITAMEIAA